jgi:hypothetical protein
MLENRYSIEGNYEPQAGLNQIFDKIQNILDYHAPQKEPDYSSSSLHPMISVDQAAKELLELMKNETNSNK